jgi:hypothetical protein
VGFTKSIMGFLGYREFRYKGLEYEDGILKIAKLSEHAAGMDQIFFIRDNEIEGISFDRKY